MLVSALRLAAGGFHVFPCSVGGKVPLTARGFKDASRDHRVITQWWTQRPGANIAMATGSISRTVVLDVDQHDSSGFDTLASLGHKLPETVSSVTGGGGEHHIFRHPGGIKSGTDKLGPGLDIRAEGGYVILPPSTHKSGRRYEWDNAPGEVSIAELPDWIAAAVASRPAEQRVPASEMAARASSPVLEGHRTTRVTQLVGHLLARRVNVDVAVELMLAWNERNCKPPLAESKVIATCGGIAKKEARKNR